MQRSGRGHLYVITAAILWGTTGTAQAFAPTGAQPTTVGALRMVVGGSALLLFALARGGFRRGPRWPLVATAFAGGSMAAYQPLFFAGVAATGVAVGTIVTIGSAPVLAGLLALIVRRERPDRRWGVATVLAVAGCGLLIAPGEGLRVDAGGVLLALGAGLAYAAYSVSGKRLLDAQPPDIAMAVVFCVAAVILAPLLVRADLSWVQETRGLAVMPHLGLAATTLAYLLFARGLHAVPVATAVTLSLAEPLTAGILGILLLGEPVTPRSVFGIALLLGGLGLLSRSRERADAVGGVR